MNLSTVEFINAIKSGMSEKELNTKEHPATLEELNAMGIKRNPATLKYLVKHCGHTVESAMEHLNTDYENGYTVCAVCGSYYHLGKGFTKHVSNGCLHCEGAAKHELHFNRGEEKLGFAPRWMGIVFDDGMHYEKAKLQIELYKNEVAGIHQESER